HLHRLVAVARDVDTRAETLQDADAELLVDGVVFHQQDAAAGEDLAVAMAVVLHEWLFPALGPGGRPGKRRTGVECRTQSDLAEDTDLPIHTLDQPFRQRQADAHAAVLAGGRRIALHEGME